MKVFTILLSLALTACFVGCTNKDIPHKQGGVVLIDFEDNVQLSLIEEIEERFDIDLKPTSVLFSKTKLMKLENVTESQFESISNYIRTGYGRYIQSIEWSQVYSVPQVNNHSYYNEPDITYDFSSYPNDPLYIEGKQWNMTMIGVEKAWDSAKGEKIIVAVLDTGISNGNGIYPRVPDLRETCMVKGRNFTSDGKEDDPYDMHGHGTHVGGTIAQSTNNGIGVVGVAPQACLMPVKVLSDEGSGFTEDIAEAIIWATDNGAKVINMSLGGGGYSKVLADAVKYAADNGVFLACAAGNNGTARIEYPAAHDGCNAISSVGKSGNLAFYSSYGLNGDGIFVAAPGGDQRADGKEGGIWQNTIVENDPKKHGYFPFQGTSMATPHVAGVAALAFSANPKATLDDVKKAMRDSASKREDKAKYGNGVVNASGTVELIKQNKSCENSGFGFAISVLFGLIPVVLFRSRYYLKRTARQMVC
jgi:serine protease